MPDNLTFAGTIRKIQHAAISHNRQQILHSAAKAKANVFKAKSSTLSDATSESQSGDESVAAQLAESEKAIMEIEA
jgi:enolase